MSTYVPIQAITLTADTATVDFTGIPQTFTDLVIVTSVANNQISTSSIGTRIQVGNNTIDTGSNYSSTLLAGEGTGAATSSRLSSSTYSLVGEILGTTGRLFPQTIQIMNYSNTTTHKTIFSRSGTSSRAEIVSSLWRSTSAINQIRFTLNSNSYVAGSTFTLYGIGSGAPKAFGGSEVRTDGTYWYHIFNSSGQFTPTQALTVDYLVVAGGGAGGSGNGGGGGAGGYRTSIGGTPLSLTAQSYSVTVGAGGVGVSVSNGGNGNASIFNTITSTGGGGGGSASTENGNSGGSGGGGARLGGIYGAGNTPSTSPSQGNNGGNGDGGDTTGGGGGGATSSGVNGTSSKGGNGGSGTSSSISGTSVTYAGGGGGGGYGITPGSGGSGGGASGTSTSATPSNATANTGGGGGGSGYAGSYFAGSNGGSGIVIVRYTV